MMLKGVILLLLHLFCDIGERKSKFSVLLVLHLQYS